MTQNSAVTGLILAGGMARRMGGQDKGLITLNNRALIAYIIDILAPQVGTIFINANRHLDHYQAFGYPVFKDEISDFQGPLAGFASGLKQVSSDYIATTPCDGPFLANDYVVRLTTAADTHQSKLCVAHDGTRLQPVYALIHRSLLNSLVDFLAAGSRKIDLWYEQVGYAKVDFSDKPEMFTNINTPQDLELAEKTLIIRD